MRSHQNGFGLVELLVVIAILSIFGAITAPNLLTGLPKYRVKRADSDVAA